MLNWSHVIGLLLISSLLSVHGCGESEHYEPTFNVPADAGNSNVLYPSDTGMLSPGDTSAPQMQDTAPAEDTAPQSPPIETCNAAAIGLFAGDTYSITFDGMPASISAWHNPTSHCLTDIDLAFQRGGACPLTLRFGVKDGVWTLTKGQITSTPECGEGWGSGKTYSAVLSQSTGTLLEMPEQVLPVSDSQVCTLLDKPIKLAGSLVMESGDKQISLSLNGLGVSGGIVSTAALGGSCGHSPTVCDGLTCGTDPYLKVDCGTCASGTFCADGQCVEGGQLDNACWRFNEDRSKLFEGNWSGNAGSCNAGSMDPSWEQRALLSINLYRWFANLPPLTLNSQLSASAQQCALIQHANNSLSHHPPSSWNCYSQSGAAAAGSSNLATTPAVKAADLYMIDPGNPQTLGHRRWILSNWLSYTAFGSTNGYSCMYTQSGGAGANSPWTAWPAPGVYPMEWSDLGWTDMNATGWTIQSDSINLANAEVTVTSNGKTRPMNVTKLLSGYGSTYALSMVPSGWKMQNNTTYNVQVAGTNPPISYAFTTVMCSEQP
jgi:hypothetical protein